MQPFLAASPYLAHASQPSPSKAPRKRPEPSYGSSPVKGLMPPAKRPQTGCEHLEAFSGQPQNASKQPQPHAATASISCGHMVLGNGAHPPADAPAASAASAHAYRSTTVRPPPPPPMPSSTAWSSKDDCGQALSVPTGQPHSVSAPQLHVPLPPPSARARQLLADQPGATPDWPAHGAEKHALETAISTSTRGAALKCGPPAQPQAVHAGRPANPASVLGTSAAQLPTPATYTEHRVGPKQGKAATSPLPAKLSAWSSLPAVKHPRFNLSAARGDSGRPPAPSAAPTAAAVTGSTAAPPAAPLALNFGTGPSPAAAAPAPGRRLPPSMAAARAARTPADPSSSAAAAGGGAAGRGLSPVAGQRRGGRNPARDAKYAPGGLRDQAVAARTQLPAVEYHGGCRWVPPAPRRSCRAFLESLCGRARARPVLWPPPASLVSARSYITTAEDAEAWCARMLAANAPVIGLDAEWKPYSGGIGGAGRTS